MPPCVPFALPEEAEGEVAESPFPFTEGVGDVAELGPPPSEELLLPLASFLDDAPPSFFSFFSLGFLGLNSVITTVMSLTVTLW